ncbi:unnamed protein product [Absidia cylindrospora]
MSSVLVIQQRNQYQNIPTEYLSPSLLGSIHSSLVCELAIRKRMGHENSTAIKDILQDYRYGEKDTLDARFDLISLAKKSTGSEKNVILAVEALIPTMKDLDVERVSENHLTASYVHPLMQSLLAITSPDKIAHW